MRHSHLTHLVILNISYSPHFFIHVFSKTALFCKEHIPKAPQFAWYLYTLIYVYICLYMLELWQTYADPGKTMGLFSAKSPKNNTPAVSDLQSFCQVVA